MPKSSMSSTFKSIDSQCNLIHSILKTNAEQATLFTFHLFWTGSKEVHITNEQTFKMRESSKGYLYISFPLYYAYVT